MLFAFQVEVLDGENHVLFDSFETDALQSEEDDPEGVALPYYAYSRPGVAQVCRLPYPVYPGGMYLIGMYLRI